MAFQHVCDAPRNWLFALTLLFVGWSLTTWAWCPPYQGPVNFAPGDDKYSPAPAFLGLWAVQAAMVAVVYPIVVAFVTVLIQRQAASKASLQAYFGSSAAKLTGLSCLALVLLMALQFPLLDSVKPLTGFAWLVADAMWFVLNAALSIYFLSATFEFASPDGRTRARNRYVLTKAWPDEWAANLSRLVALQPEKHNLLRGVPSALDDTKGTEPAFSAWPDHFGSVAALRTTFRGAKEVADIRYALVQSAFNSWRRRASLGAAGATPAAAKRSNLSRPGPVLEAGVNVFDDFSHDTPLFKTNGYPLVWPEKLLLRLSLRLRRAPRSRVLVLDALDEARQDAAAAIHQDSVADFEKRVIEFLEFIDDLVESSHYIEDGKSSNWVLMQASNRLFGQRSLIDEWLRSLVDLHSVALTAIETRGDFAERTVRTAARLFRRQEEFLCAELRRKYTSVQYWQIRLLLDWAAERLPSEPAAGAGRLLSEPLKRRYDEILKEAVSAWESLKNWRLDSDLPAGPSAWTTLQELAPEYELHLRHSAALVGAALRANDRAGTYWFGDSFRQWRRQLQRYGAEDGVSYADKFKVLFDDLLTGLKEFRAKYPLPEYQTESAETLKTAWFTGIGNLWKDVGLVLVATAVSRQGQPPSQQDLTREFAVRSLGIAQGDAEDSEVVAPSADRVIASLLRVNAIGSAAYSERVDNIAEALVPSAVSEGVPGRIYGSVGTALDRLPEGYLLILAYLAPAGWRVSSQFDEAIRSWTGDDEVRRRALQHFGSLLAQARNAEIRARLQASWTSLRLSDKSFAEQLDVVAHALEDFIHRIETARLADIQALEVAPSQLARVAGQAAQGLADPWHEAPFSLFSHRGVLHERTPAEQFTVRIAGWDKGTLTEPQMAQAAVNEGEYVSDAIRQTAALQLMRALVAGDRGPVQGVESQAGFLAAVEAFCEQAVAVSEQPVLLVASRVDPPWLVDLRRNKGSGARLRDVPGRTQDRSYVGHLGPAEVLIAPCSPGESVLCWRSVFVSLALSDTVTANAVPEKEPQRCTLELTWYQRPEFRPDAPVQRLQHRKRQAS